MTFAYDSNFNLITVTSADGATFTAHYDDATLPGYITSITTSYGASAIFTYDDSFAELRNITDAAGLVSQMSYQHGYGAPTELITPYGTTTFDVGAAGTGVFDRILRITLPNG